VRIIKQILERKPVKTNVVISAVQEQSNRKKSNRSNYLITALRQAFFLIFIFIRRYNLLVTIVTLLSLDFIQDDKTCLHQFSVTFPIRMIIYFYW